MRTRFPLSLRLGVLVLLSLISAFPASLDISWQPSVDDARQDRIPSYKLYYGLQDFTDPRATNVSIIPLEVGSNTWVNLPNLVGGLTYYFAVVSVENGVESDYSNVASYLTPAEFPAPFPIFGSNSFSATNGSGGSGTDGEIPESSPTQVNLIGMLPRIWLYPTNGIALLAIQGTVGATFAIQSSTAPSIPSSWTTITNLKLSLPSPNANPNPGSTLEKAFVPALESVQDPTAIDCTLRYYRIYMPLGYAILADQVLAQQGFNPRLIAVRCPGLSGYIVCYVTEEAAYLDYNSATYVVRLEQSGATIREVANKVANSITQNWTSASEFTVTDDGAKLLFATIVRTDDPSSDPPLGTPRGSSSDIVIDF